MAQIGRNDPCPCGSGKKYKKCCLGKVGGKSDQTRKAEPGRQDVSGWGWLGGMMRHTGPEGGTIPGGRGKRPPEWDSEKIGAMSTARILAKVKDFGVPMTTSEFIRQAPQFLSAVEMAEDWYKRYPVNATGLDEDFIRMAATVLWPRLTPDVMSSEKLDDMMQQGYDLVENGRVVEGCRIWLEVWERLKRRFKPEMNSIEEAESVFTGLQCLFNWCQDLEEALGNAGRADSGYLQKRIDYCSEFCALFPSSDETVILNMKRAVAESYFALGLDEEGEKVFAALVEQFPDNAWGHIGRGDAYLWPRKGTPPDYDRAERIYRVALESNLTRDRDAVEDRLEEVEKAGKQER